MSFFDVLCALCRLDYFSTECVYAPFAARGFTRDFVKDLEVRRDVAGAAINAFAAADNWDGG